MSNNYLLFGASVWAKDSAWMLHKLVFDITSLQGFCNVMLTGGRSAEAVYYAWKAHPNFSLLKGVNFFFGDERCVDPDSFDSNFRMVSSSLFASVPLGGCNIFRIHGEAKDLEAEAIRYSSLLPESIDILLLGVGVDGHIASMFPGDKSWLNSGKKVIYVSSSSHPFDRITITPNVISISKNVFVLAPGVEKAQLYLRMSEDLTNILEMPALLVADKVWLLDYPIKNMNNKNYITY